jgi:serine/threonine protein kinase
MESPDAVQNAQYKGHIADAYSCGVTLYILLAGRFPFGPADEDGSCSNAVRLQRLLTRVLAGDITPLPQVSASTARPWAKLLSTKVASTANTTRCVSVLLTLNNRHSSCCRERRKIGTP